MRRGIRIAIYSLLGGMVVLLAAIVLLCQHTPGWYRPVTYSLNDQQEATAGLNALVLGVNNDLNRAPAGRPITRTIDQDQLNRYLQALPLYDPRAKTPDWLADPVIVLDKDRLILAGRIAKLGNRPVSVHLRLRVQDDLLSADVEQVAIGSMPLPRQVIRDQLGELGDLVGGAGRGGRPDGGQKPRQSVKDVLLDLGELFFRAIDGEPMPCQRETWDLRRPFRLHALQIEPGKMTLTFLPMGEPAAPSNEPRPSEEPGP
jgi:hypothetical protein